MHPANRRTERITRSGGGGSGDVATRAMRIGGIFVAAFGVLLIRFVSGIFPENEVSQWVHWGLLPIGLLLGVAGGAMEASEAVAVGRRDALFGLSGALLGFVVLRIAGVI